MLVMNTCTLGGGAHTCCGVLNIRVPYIRVLYIRVCYILRLKTAVGLVDDDLHAVSVGEYRYLQVPGLVLVCLQCRSNERDVVFEAC